MNSWTYLKSILPTHNAMLLVVVDSKGSSPGRQGFKMIVSENNNLFGSIGGGVMEYKLVKEAKNHLSEKNFTPLLIKQIHKGKVKERSGMICSGEQTIAIYRLTHRDLATIKEICNTLNQQKNSILNYNEKELFYESKSQALKYSFENLKDEKWLFIESLDLKEHIYIIGAGHVGLATSQLFYQLGFNVTILDNRHNLNTYNQNKFVHAKLIIDYNKVDYYIPENENNYIVIMTNKCMEDKLVLSKLIGKNYKYLGILGSKSKLQLIFNAFEKEGFSKEDLLKVYKPLGLPIHCKTPLEIAISIAAQIIQLKNK